jgi:hypothetical protein
LNYSFALILIIFI